jgi:hypothetical protein
LRGFKRVFAISTSCRTIGMTILQIRPMMRELVQRAIGPQRNRKAIQLHVLQAGLSCSGPEHVTR